jgi:Na+/proline symporter
MRLEAVLFLVFLGISFLIGAVASRSVKSVSDYFVAGARMPWFFIVGTFVASNVSAGLFLGATNMTALHGYAMWCAYFTTSIGFILGIAVVGVLVRRLASHYEIYDFADILATRYCSQSNAVRALTTVVVPIVYVPLLAAQLIGLATIAGSMLDLPYETVLTGITLMVVLYTMLGGMIGVVWTDGFQFIVLLVGMILAVPIAMSALGDGDPAHGWQQITEMPQEIFKGMSDSWPWYLLLGQFVWIFSIPVQPHLVTRFLTARDERSILIALPVCVTAGLIIYSSTVPVGLLGKLTTPDLPAGGYYYVELARKSLGPWLGAFALAGIAAAALSTSSTILIVTGQSLSREVYQKWLVPDASDKQALVAARIAVMLVGLITFGIAWFQPLGIFWLVVLSASLLASVFFVPIFAGFFSQSASAKGAIAAMIAGGLAASVVFAINEWYDMHLFVSELFAGLGTSTLAMWIVSNRYPASAEERQVQDRLTRPVLEGVS